MACFADKLKAARKKAGLSQAELAERIGVTVRSFTDYECGRAVPRQKKIEKLADALGVTTLYLMNDSVDDPGFGIHVEATIRNAGKQYGESIADEMSSLLERNAVFFAGGETPQEVKDRFFEALMTAYLTCKQESAKSF